MKIHHCVFFTFRADVPAMERAMVYKDLCALQDKIGGLDRVVYGPNTSFEGMARGYDEGFVMTFVNREAHMEYHDHEDHKKAGARLVAATEGGIDGIFVFDFESPE